MGVRFLETVVSKKVPNGIISVDIKQEVEEYKRQHNGQNPSIIIDTLTLQGHAYTNHHEVLLGGRYNIYTNIVTEMFSKLKNLGVNLVFFIDGPVQDEKISTCLDRRNGNYDCCVEILHAIDNGMDISDEDKAEELSVQNLTPFIYNFAKILSQFGLVHISQLNECDLEIARFATRTGALAIISQDTDFLIYEGDWHYWSAVEIDFEDLTTIEYNRSALREYLSLSSNQMALFATISGNDILKFDFVENFHRRIAPKRYNTFQKIAEIVRKLRSSSTNFTYTDMKYLLKTMFPANQHQIAKPLILSSLKSYNYNTMKTSFGDGILNATSKDIEYFNFVILANRSCILPVYYYDLSDPTFTSFYDLIMPLIRSQMGILLQHLNDQSVTRKFYCKKTHEELYQEYEERPRYPEAKVPPIMDLLFTPFGNKEILDNIRWNFLCWQISPKLNSNILKQIPKNSLITVLVIFYLFEKNQIDMDEADCLLLANNCPYVIANNLNLEDATIVNGRDARLAFLFSGMYIHIKNCVFACGLRAFCSLITFDGLYFHILRKKWTGEYSRFDKENEISPYKNLRLYSNEYHLL